MSKPELHETQSSLEVGECPVCRGTKRVPAGDKHWVTQCTGYDKATHTVPCTNCGGQYMFGFPTGLVRYNTAGVPCTHKYIPASNSHQHRTYRMYVCTQCGDSYDIDSGD